MTGLRPVGSSAAGGPSASRAADTELERVALRWAQLPVDRALRAYPALRRLVQELADETARVTGQPQETVPDLGPAVVIDQLRVMVYDRREAGIPDEAVRERLRAVRRSLP